MFLTPQLNQLILSNYSITMTVIGLVGEGIAAGFMRKVYLMDFAYMLMIVILLSIFSSFLFQIHLNIQSKT